MLGFASLWAGDTLLRPVVGVDVIERARIVVGAAEIRAGRGNVLRVLVTAHAHAIDVDERLVRQGDAGVAPEADRASRARAAGGLLDARAGDPPGQHV